LKAVILAAGEGTRMRPFTRGQPKVMLPVGNRPVLEYLVQALARNGIRDIVMVVGYHKERIMSYFKDGMEWKVRIQYVQQEKQLGTAHALKMAEGYLKDDSYFLLLAGDNIVDEEDLADLVDSQEDEALLVTRSRLSTKYGVVGMRGDQVISIEEKSIQGMEAQIFTGIGHFRTTIFNYLHDDVYLLTSLIQERLKDGPLQAIKASTWMDAVYPQDLLRLNSRVLQELPAGYGGIVEPGVMFKDHVHVGEGCILRANTYLKGPIIIGEGGDLGPCTTFNGPVSIGENSSVGPFCEISNCIIMDNVTIGMGSKLKNAVIGSGTTIEARFTTSRGGLRQYDRLGIAIGEDCDIKENVLVDNGVTIGNSVHIDAGRRISRSLEDHTLVV